MKGRSLEELDELFQNRVSVRNFRKYQCVSSQQAREIAEQKTAENLNELDGEKEGAVVEHRETNDVVNSDNKV